MNATQYSVTDVVGGTAKTTRSSRPVHPYDGLDKLPENVRIEDRGNDGVWLITTPPQTHGRDGKPYPRAEAYSTRVDSMDDKKIVRAGGTLWFSKFLAAK